MKEIWLRCVGIRILEGEVHDAVALARSNVLDPSVDKSVYHIECISGSSGDWATCEDMVNEIGQ